MSNTKLLQVMTSDIQLLRVDVAAAKFATTDLNVTIVLRCQRAGASEHSKLCLVHPGTCRRAPLSRFFKEGKQSAEVLVATSAHPVWTS